MLSLQWTLALQRSCDKAHDRVPSRETRLTCTGHVLPRAMTDRLIALQVCAGQDDYWTALICPSSAFQTMCCHPLALVSHPPPPRFGFLDEREWYLPRDCLMQTT